MVRILKNKEWLGTLSHGSCLLPDIQQKTWQWKQFRVFEPCFNPRTGWWEEKVRNLQQNANHLGINIVVSGSDFSPIRLKPQYGSSQAARPARADEEAAATAAGGNRWYHNGKIWRKIQSSLIIGSYDNIIVGYWELFHNPIIAWVMGDHEITHTKYRASSDGMASSSDWLKVKSQPVWPVVFTIK